MGEPGVEPKIGVVLPPQIIPFVHRVGTSLFSPSILGGKISHPYFWETTPIAGTEGVDFKQMHCVFLALKLLSM